MTAVQSINPEARRLREEHEARIREEAGAQGFERGKAERFDEVKTVYQDEIARREMLHIESDRKAEAHGFWRGSAIFGIISLLLGAAGGIWGSTTVMFGAGAVTNRAIQTVTPGPSYGLQALPEDSQPVDELPGYARPGREPASAPR